MLKATLATLVSALKGATTRKAAESVIKHAERVGRSGGYRSGLKKAAEIVRH